MTLVIGVDVPEAFMQLKISKRNKGKPLAIQAPFGWAIFGSSRNSGILQEKKVAVNSAFTSELNYAVKKFWEI